jgi:NADH dehydrogenase FAD-containing subunit
VTLADYPETPKAGVYAVRQGPVLARNLRAALGEGSPATYVPQRTFLSLLNTADGKALLRWHGIVSHSRFAWWLKDRIDRRFVRRYRAPG